MGRAEEMNTGIPDSEIPEVKFDTQGGDANLLNLANRVIRGVKKREQAKENDKSKMWRRIHGYFDPVKILVQFMYVFQT